MTIPEAKQNPVMTRLSSDESEDLARTVSSEVSRTEHVFVTNEDEISPKEAIAKLNKNTEKRL